MARKQVVVLQGSARTGGTSDRLAGMFVSQVSALCDVQVSHIRACDVQVRPCTACDACKAGNCVIDDDMTRILPQLEEADVVVVATPVYFCSVPAPLKMIIDRMQPLFFKKYVRGAAIKKKTGVLLSCCDRDVNEPFVGVAKVVEALFFCLNAEFAPPVYHCAEEKLTDAAVAIKDKIKTAAAFVAKK